MRKRAYLLAGLFVLLLIVASLAFMLARHQPSRVPAEGQLRPDTLKLLVSQDGFYRASLGSLQRAGLSLERLASDNVSLSQGGRPVPYLLDSDGLIFYGQAPDSRYTTLRPYLLQTGQAGFLMAEATAGPAGAAPLATVPQTLHLEENQEYDGRARDDTAGEPWYWHTLQVQSQVTIEFTLPAVASAPARLQLKLWGATHNDSVENDHDFDLVINGQIVGTVRWDGESHHLAEVEAPAGVLQAGENTIVLDNAAEGATLVDIMRLDWLEVMYQTPPAASDDRFFLAGVEGQVTVGGFSDRPWLFDVTRPEAPLALTGWEYGDGQATFAARPESSLALVGPDGTLEPDSLQPLRQSHWQDSHNQADLLIVTTDALAPALEPLAQARREQGLAVAVIPVAELYDEFGSGQEGPEAINAFVQHALTRWAEPRPAYLFLVGDATYDYRHYLGTGPANVVPAPMVPVSFSGETVSDARLADVDGDWRPDLAVGRWPVGDPRLVADLVRRTLAYEQEQTAGQVIFAADGTSPEFTQVSDSLIQASALPAGQVTRLYGAPAAELAQAWQQGAWLLTYTGHGSLERWGKDGVFSSEAVEELDTTGSPPIVLQLTCLTGYFAHPEITSLSELMLAYEEGPVIIIAATSLTLSAHQEPFGANLLGALQDPAVSRIGDALQQAKLALDVASNDGLREISDTFGLLGDPSALIARPETK
ncbi:MAG: C25 family cysteine peptidase [Chloroflexi bacterium]|nr:C25 family cysteine peptidase [Chloroflexota bacterium]